eukprot:TRINITY_DN471_c0_g1_i10.p1 TRINITY_DN471_c0_g1~~TRINITY_DN471_c0_g1_i10.p1  ORF type:complete len:1241 (+),score=364.70 TRINITY_DN471_c0_g1_i10:2656-6378(+)
MPTGLYRNNMRSVRGCASTRINYPNCTECTSAVHCSGNAASVVPNAGQTVCDCTCRNWWSGDECETCGRRFDGADCDRCAPAFTGATCEGCAVGYVVYPDCTPCNTTVHCNGHADSVTSNGDNTECVCTCAEGYTGATCDACDDGYVGYPACVPCTSQDHCSGHAAAVVPNAMQTECVCTCRNYWEGDQCETCESKYANDCSECAVGHIDPAPECTRCDTGVHCSSHADNVSDDGTRAFCRCECRNQWVGDECETCPGRYGGGDCGECAEGAFDYPVCGACDDAFCHNRSVAVATDANKTMCNCTCRNQWVGAQCTDCPAAYAGGDCERCAAHRFGYPECELCTVEGHCSGHATSVTHTDDRSACNCTCEGNWVGADCGVCPVQFEGEDCDRCAVGYVGRLVAGVLECERCDFGICAVTGGVEHARNVSDDGTRSECVCDCVNQWTGPLCDACPAVYDGSGCDVCAAGRIEYPNCTLCTAERHCSGHADAVAPDEDQTVCECDCRNQWSGAECENCSAVYSSDRDCGACAEGHVQYPNCTLCTLEEHCSGNADVVRTDVEQTRCECECRNGWLGENCETCPENFGGADCDRCAAGHYGYPICARCTNEEHCNGNAWNVTDDGTRSYCMCKCADQWTGVQCEKCARRHALTPVVRGGVTVDSCAACAPGSITYPHCYACADKCSSHTALITTNDDQTECACECRNSWTGPTCDVCPEGYGGHDCEQCLRSFTEIWVGYPNCVKSCSFAGFCEPDRASGLTIVDRQCACDCRNGWSGARCDVCSVPYGGDDCDMCAVGWVKEWTWVPAPAVQLRPDVNGTDDEAGSTNGTELGLDMVEIWECVECTAEDHCDGRSLDATSNDTGDVCLCQNCTNYWSGANCSTCAWPAGGENCECCAEGLVVDNKVEGICPCRNCSVELDCNADNTLFVTSHQINDTCLWECKCHCRNMWEGANCSFCPAQYDAEQDCGACQNGGSYPECGLAVSEQLDEEARSCWEPFQGFCFWLVTLLGMLLCSCILVYVHYVQRKKRMEDADAVPMSGGKPHEFDMLVDQMENELEALLELPDIAEGIAGATPTGQVSSPPLSFDVVSSKSPQLNQEGELSVPKLQLTRTGLSAAGTSLGRYVGDDQLQDLDPLGLSAPPKPQASRDPLELDELLNTTTFGSNTGSGRNRPRRGSSRPSSRLGPPKRSKSNLSDPLSGIGDAAGSPDPLFANPLSSVGKRKAAAKQNKAGSPDLDRFQI